ncbi:DegV domain-containing protein [Candidatus Izimaplasma bacterium HR1]|jgi:DegV family protein with EDD domain|uniref:DegV family protein n=1 Tax=Candidatus Izimoplasma sp. HR1 TaxID=1541959 RepID=UPI0004F89F4E|nr:DegV domain-containing protein [Candidatus Izimaplasma bacterium HR1]
MSKIGLLVCGNSGIDYIDHKYDISVIRSILFVGHTEYSDYVDIKAGDFYKMLLEDPSLTPTTAQAATGVIVEQYKEMIAKGYDELIVISVSQKLSGTYEGCVLAANMIDDAKITVFDSGTVSFPEARMALDAAKMVQKGKTTEEIVAHLEELRDNHRILFSVETLRYLVKNGRLSGASGFFGSMLKIKPMLEVTKDGRVEAIEKIRTLSKATERIIEKFLEELGDKDVEVFMIEAEAKERVEYIRSKILEARPDIKEIKAYPLTPVVGAHAGPGCVGIGYIVK